MFRLRTKRSKEVTTTKRFQGEQLSRYMAERGMNCAEVARAVLKIMPDAKLSGATIWAMTQKDANPSSKYLGPIATVLGRTVDDFFVNVAQQ